MENYNIVVLLYVLLSRVGGIFAILFCVILRVHIFTLHLYEY
jgi:hypothetical protein